MLCSTTFFGRSCLWLNVKWQRAEAVQRDAERDWKERGHKTDVTGWKKRDWNASGGRRGKGEENPNDSFEGVKWKRNGSITENKNVQNTNFEELRLLNPTFDQKKKKKKVFFIFTFWKSLKRGRDQIKGRQTRISLFLLLVCVKFFHPLIYSIHPFIHQFPLLPLIKAVWLKSSNTFDPSGCDDFMLANGLSEFQQINWSPDLTWPGELNAVWINRIYIQRASCLMLH